MEGILYDQVQAIDKVTIPAQTKASLPNMSDYILLKMVSGQNIKINLDEVLSPDYTDIDEFYADIYSWIFGEAPPTP